VLQFLKNPSFDFMSKRNILLGISTVLVLVSLVLLFTRGLNLGIEFTGGTEVQLKFTEKPDLSAIRSTLDSGELQGSVVTTIGDPLDNEIYIRLGVSPADGTESESDDVTTKVVRALVGDEDPAKDLNLVGRRSLASLLKRAPELSETQADDLAEEILELRKESAILSSIDEVSGVPGMTPGVMEYLRGQQLTTGPLSIRSQSYIGPAIGEELQRKAGLAILGSLLGMLVYIWIRFELQWGFAAVAALFHDTVITLGLVSLFQKELSLPVVAAFLTLVGYSVNDTVVVFDRIRENLRKQHTGLEKVINTSINQTLSRTIITSGLTLIVVLALLFFGGAALNPFAFVLTMGVIVGTYSSIYIASPILLIWKKLADKRKGRTTASATPVKTQRTKKVRPRSAS